MSTHRRFVSAGHWHQGAAIFGLLLISVALAGPPPAVQAAAPHDVEGAITVNTTADQYGSGAECSLREAIEAANGDAAFGGCPAGSGADVITLPAGTYALTRAGHSEDDNATGDLDIKGGLALEGAGSGTTSIDGGGLDRVFQIHNGTVVLKQLKVSGGQAPHGADGADGAAPGAAGQNGGEGQDGGGIHNAGSLELRQVVVRGNRAGNGGKGGNGANGADGVNIGEQGQQGGEGGNAADGGRGGGIWSESTGSLALVQVTSRDNESGAGGTGGNGGDGGDGVGLGTLGGGGDTGGDGGNGGWGGGIGSDGAMSIEASTIRDNRTGPGGHGGGGGDGGVYGRSGGRAGSGGRGGSGGGIAYLFNGSTGSINDSTIAGNSTGRGGNGGSGGSGGRGGFGQPGGRGDDGYYAGDGGEGGGIRSSGPLLLTNSVVGNNSTGAGGKGKIGGSGGNGGPALIGAGSNGGAGAQGGWGGGGGSGGGIMATDEIMIIFVHILDNETGPGGDGGGGGHGGDGGDGGEDWDGGNGGHGRDGSIAGPGGMGGGIYKFWIGELSLISSTVQGNRTGGGGIGGQGGNGGASGPGNIVGDNGWGGFGSSGGRGGWGGGMDLAGDENQTVRASTIRGNSTGDGGKGGKGGDGGSNTNSYTGETGRGGDGQDGGSGGGISGGTGLKVENTTISGNSTGSGGDGGSSGSGEMGQAEGGIAGAAGSGGGVRVWLVSNGEMAATTIAHNQAMGTGGTGGTGAPAGADGTAGEGGGIVAHPGISLTHVLLGNNQASGIGPDCNGTFASSDHNLIGQAAGCTFSGATDNNITGVDPKLGPLADNGGQTWTHLPQPGSLAIDEGAAACPDTNGTPLLLDQRDRTRPMDGDDNSGKLCDIGAVEVQGFQTLAVTLSGEGEGAVASAPGGIDCGTDCQQSFEVEATVVLTTTAAAGWRFDGWSGDCKGSDSVCEVTMTGDKSVTASFGEPVSRVFLPVVLREW